MHSAARARHVGAAGLTALVLCASGLSKARAAGVEDTVTGAVTLGRAANYARVTDFMAVWQNPANLALASRELGLELRVPFFRACFDRTPDPRLAGTSGQYLPTESFDEVCNDAGPGVAGSLGFTLPLPRGFGFGVGLFTPGGVSRTKLGSERLNTVNPLPDESLPITEGVRESGNRYLSLSRAALAAFLMVGVGYQPIPSLRFGVSVGSGFVQVRATNVTSAFAGFFDDPAQVAEVDAIDRFVPRATVSVVATPIDSVDLVASLTWNDDVRAEGHLDVTANGFERAPRNSCADASPGPRCRADDVTLKVPYQRFELVVGGRYAQRRVPRERALDPMRDEVWDVEVDLAWTETSHVTSYDLDIYGEGEVRHIAVNSGSSASLLPLPRRSSVVHDWRDTFGVRLGGDYNVLPARLALRAGVAYETRAVPARNMNLDHFPVQKVTLSLGATAAFGRWRVTLAYAHLFYETVDVAVGEGNVREVAASFPRPGVPAQVVNEGKYTAGMDVLSLQTSARF